MSYDQTFASRSDQYMHAILTFPRVMQHEYQTAVEMLDLDESSSPSRSSRSSRSILHLQAGGIPLNLYLPIDHLYLPFETSPDFAKWGYPLCSYQHLPVEDHSIDRFIVLASLHHASDNERTALFHEVQRVMRPGGRMILGDVRRGSKQDRWLNEFVHLHNVSGHVGRFFEEEEVRQHLAACGWRVTSVQLATYPWVFDDRESMIQFTRELFGLKSELSDETVMRALCTYLDVKPVGDGYHILWELLYVIGEKEVTTSFPIPTPPGENTPDDPPMAST